MTVAQLIEKLKQFPQNLAVTTNLSSYPYELLDDDDVQDIKLVSDDFYMGFESGWFSVRGDFVNIGP